MKGSMFGGYIVLANKNAEKLALFSHSAWVLPHFSASVLAEMSGSDKPRPTRKGGGDSRPVIGGVSCGSRGPAALTLAPTLGEEVQITIHGLERAETRGICGREIEATLRSPLLEMRGRNSADGRPKWLSFSAPDARLVVVVHGSRRWARDGGGSIVTFITGYSTHVAYGAELALQDVELHSREEPQGLRGVVRLAQRWANAIAASELVENLARLHSDDTADDVPARAWGAAADALSACLGGGDTLTYAAEALKARRGTADAGKLLDWFRAYASNTRRWLAVSDPVLHQPHKADEVPKEAKAHRGCRRDATVPGLCNIAAGGFRMVTASVSRLDGLAAPANQLAAACALLMLLTGAEEPPLSRAHVDADLERVRSALCRISPAFVPAAAAEELAPPATAAWGPSERAERCPDLRAMCIRALLASAKASALVRRHPGLLVQVLEVVEPVAAAHPAPAAGAGDGAPAAGGAGAAVATGRAAGGALGETMLLTASEVHASLIDLLDTIVAERPCADVPDILDAFSLAFTRTGHGGRVPAAALVPLRSALGRSSRGAALLGVILGSPGA